MALNSRRIHHFFLTKAWKKWRLFTQQKWQYWFVYVRKPPPNNESADCKNLACFKGKSDRGA